MNRRASTSRDCTRRGFSLIEMLTVIAVSGILMGIIVSLLVVMMDWDRNTRARAVWGGELARLTDSLRDDVRLATAVSNPAGDTLVVTLSDERRVEYKLAETTCHRTEVGSSEPADQGQVFSVGLPASWQVEFADSEDSASRPLVTVQLDRKPRDAADPAPMPITVIAALGADRSLTTSNPADQPSADSE